VGSQGEGGNSGGILVAPITGGGNREGEAVGCDHFQRGRGGGGEAAPQCRGRTT
jgi:hypothetical protein